MKNTISIKLQKADRKQASLYLFCNFISLLLITAFSAMMFSPTVLLVLPEGGDSRKQMTAIFVLALFGCVVFTIYASCLFFRQKAKQLGTLMALGASRKWLAPGLYREILFLSGTSSLLGILAGFPFVWVLWNLFRLLVVDSQEMKLVLDFRCLILSALFFVLVVAFSCLTARRYLKRTNIIDTIHEEHKNEPVKEPGRWCGPVGFLLLFAGAILGYFAPNVYMNLFRGHYPPAWLNLFYAPVFIGLYMVMLHTVVHGWRSYKKHPYKNIIARNMMKFQGKQTVNTLLVSTVLIAGASFALFYLPMLSTGHFLETAHRPFAYSYRFPLSQSGISHDAVTAMSEKYNLDLTNWIETPYLVLALDGLVDVSEDDTSYREEYRELTAEGRFLSESAYRTLTKNVLDVAPGTYYMISNDTETATYFGATASTLLTNMTTRETLPTSFAGFTHYEFLSGQIPFYVIDDADYAAIGRGIGADWTEKLICFDIGGEDNYDFATEFFYAFVDTFDAEYARPSYYSRVAKIYADEAGLTYWGDTDRMTHITFDEPDSSDFQNYWIYMPKITILDKNNFMRNYAVFLMMFLFMAIICILAALVINYTRCMTIAFHNRYVFDDLRRLGASPTFLLREVKNQAKNVFAVPAGIGMSAMFLLYAMILYANDGVLIASELLALGGCLLLLFLLTGIFYLFYKRTVKNMAVQLGIIAP